MVGAHQHEVAQLGRAAIRPVTDVVAVAVPGWAMTPGESTAAVTEVEGVADGPGNQAA